MIRIPYPITLNRKGVEVTNKKVQLLSLVTTTHEHGTYGVKLKITTELLPF